MGSDWLFGPPPGMPATSLDHATSRAATRFRLERRRHGGMLATHGPGPEGTTCGQCAHLEAHGNNRKAYFKCRRYGVSSSDATDWRKKWAACGLFFRVGP